MVTEGQWRQTEDGRGFCVILSVTASGCRVQFYSAVGVPERTGQHWIARRDVETSWPVETTLEDVIFARVVADRVRSVSAVMEPGDIDRIVDAIQRAVDRYIAGSSRRAGSAGRKRIA